MKTYIIDARDESNELFGGELEFKFNIGDSLLLFDSNGNKVGLWYISGRTLMLSPEKGVGEIQLLHARPVDEGEWDGSVDNPTDLKEEKVATAPNAMIDD